MSSDINALIDRILRRTVAQSGPPVFPDEDFDSPEAAEQYRRDFNAKYRDEIAEWLTKPHFSIRSLVDAAVGPDVDGLIRIPVWRPE